MMLVATPHTNHGCGRPGLAGIVTVTVLVLVLVLTVVLLLVVVVVVDPVVVVVVVVVVGPVVVVGGVVVVVSVVVAHDTEVVRFVVVIGAAVRAVLDTGASGLGVELEPPKIKKTISAKRSPPRAPNPTSAQGVRYHGTAAGWSES